MMCGLWIRWTPTKNNEVNPWLHPHSKPQMTPFHVCLSYFEAELMLIRLILFHQLIFVFVHLVDILCEAHLETLLSDHVTSLLLWSVFYSFLSHCVIFLLRGCYNYNTAVLLQMCFCNFVPSKHQTLKVFRSGQKYSKSQIRSSVCMMSTQAWFKHAHTPSLLSKVLHITT